MNNLSIRHAKKSDFTNILDYFLTADEDLLLAMGVDVKKLPSKEEWLGVLIEEFEKSTDKRSLFYVIWEQATKAIGHSNINQIVYGEEAHFHLHLWNSATREKGMGLAFIKMTIPIYFKVFKLKKLYCEPYAFNPAPNKILEKLGFEFIEQYSTIPGSINLYQPVNKWCLNLKKFEVLFP